MVSYEATTASDIPFDIWLHISDFLTDEQVKEMYGVNRAFFHISIAIRYRELEIGMLHGTGLRRCLFISRHLPAMKACVRSLALKTTIYDLPVSEEVIDTISESGPGGSISHNLRPRSLWERLKKMALASRRCNKPQSLDSVLYLNRFIKALGYVMELTIVSHFNHSLVPPSACSLTLLDAAWKGFGSTLRRLTLKGECSLLEAVLHDSIHLERLEYLSVEIEWNRYAGNVNVAISALVRFIERHSSTLKTLDIFSNEVIDFGLLTRGIGTLPRLRRFQFRQPPPNQPFHDSAIQEFLLRHQDTITNFDWGYTGPLLPAYVPLERWESVSQSDQAPFNITLPNLSRFAVSGVCPERTFLKSAISFVGRHQKSLTRLSFASWMLSVDSFAILVHAAASPVLEELDIGVELLTPTVLVTLATRFPSLEVLGLAYDKTGRQLAIPTVRDSATPINVAERMDIMYLVHGFMEFREDLERLTLAEWPVKTLNIWRCACSGLHEHMTERVAKVVVAKLPRIGFVNGVYRESFVAKPE